MITKWQTLALKVSKELDIPYMDVVNTLKLYSVDIHSNMKKITHLEYDFFFIGKMVARKKKLNKYRENLLKSGTYPETLVLVEKLHKHYQLLKKYGRRKANEYL